MTRTFFFNLTFSCPGVMETDIPDYDIFSFLLFDLGFLVFILILYSQSPRYALDGPSLQQCDKLENKFRIASGVNGWFVCFGGHRLDC